MLLGFSWIWLLLLLLLPWAPATSATRLLSNAPFLHVNGFTGNSSYTVIVSYWLAENPASSPTAYIITNNGHLYQMAGRRHALAYQLPQPPSAFLLMSRAGIILLQGGIRGQEPEEGEELSSDTATHALPVPS